MSENVLFTCERREDAKEVPSARETPLELLPPPSSGQPPPMPEQNDAMQLFLETACDFEQDKELNNWMERGTESDRGPNSDLQPREGIEEREPSDDGAPIDASNSGQLEEEPSGELHSDGQGLSLSEGRDYNEEEDGEEPFLDTLTAFYGSRGQYLAVPTFNHGPLKLDKLWNEVQSNGGFEQTCIGKQWAGVSRALGAPRKMTSASHTLKKIYANILLPYEQFLNGESPGVTESGYVLVSNTAVRTKRGRKVKKRQREQGTGQGRGRGPKLQAAVGRGRRVPLPIKTTPEEDSDIQDNIDSEGDEYVAPPRTFPKPRERRLTHRGWTTIANQMQEQVRQTGSHRYKRRALSEKDSDREGDEDDQLAHQLVSMANMNGRSRHGEIVRDCPGAGDGEKSHFQGGAADNGRDSRNGGRRGGDSSKRNHGNREISEKQEEEEEEEAASMDADQHSGSGDDEGDDPEGNNQGIETSIQDEEEESDDGEKESENTKERSAKRARGLSAPRQGQHRVPTPAPLAGGTAGGTGTGTTLASEALSDAVVSLCSAVADARGLMGSGSGTPVMNGVLAVAEMALMGTENGTEGDAERGLRVAATLISSMGAEISRLERERAAAVAAVADADARAVHAAGAAMMNPVITGIPGKYHHRHEEANKQPWHTTTGAFLPPLPPPQVPPPRPPTWQPYNNYFNPNNGSMNQQGTLRPPPSYSYQYNNSKSEGSGALETNNGDTPLSPPQLPPGLMGLSESELGGVLQKWLSGTQ